MYTQKKEHRLKPGVRRMLFIIPILLIIGGVYCYDKYFKSKGSSGSSLSSSNSATPSAPVNMDGSTVILKLGGSSTVGDALAPAIVKKFMEQNGYSDVQIASISKEEKSVIGTKDGKKDRIDIASKGTGKGFKALTANEIDICMASSPAPAGSTYEEHPIGLDGIAIVVNKGSTMQSIGYDEIKNVFRTRK